MKTLYILRNRVVQITLASDLARHVYPGATAVEVADNYVIGVGATYVIAPTARPASDQDRLNWSTTSVDREELHRLNLSLSRGTRILECPAAVIVDGVTYELNNANPRQFVAVVTDPRGLGMRPRFLVQPQSQVVPLGAKVQFQAIALAATGLQWTKNGTNIAGATGTVLEIASAAESDSAAVYVCIATNALGSTQSGPVTLTVGGVGAVSPAGEVPMYLGNIGTRCILPRQKLGSSLQFNSKAFHRVATAKENPIFEFPGVMGANGVSSPTGDGDVGVGTGGMAIRASLEYPAGVFTRLTFAGSPNGVTPNGGFLRCDPVVGLTIPARTGFFVWVYGETTGADRPIVFSTGGADNNYAILGESYEHAASGLTDKSDGTPFAVNPVGPGLAYRCTQILAQTTDRSFAVVGDSRQAAPRAQHDADGQNGTLARAISQVRGVTVPSVTGDLAQVWDPVTKVPARRLMLDNVSDVVICIGRNDIYSGGSPASLATIQARFNIIAGVVASKGKRLGRATLMPDTTSTDNWTTADKQSTKAAEAVRVAYNDWLRNPANFPANSYLVDLADMAEVNAAGVLTRNGGRWLPGKTYDGIHQTIEFDAELVAQVRAAIGI